jgi:hypothetical protein
LSEPYHYVRFRWWNPLDLDKLVSELGAAYKMVKRASPRNNHELSLYRDVREEVTITADTLGARLSPVRAVLFQKERKPFTKKDVALRKVVVDMYDKTTPTPFPWSGSFEPKYDVEDEKKVG